jgi:hypothetical protein
MTYIFSVHLVTPFSHDQWYANGLLHEATKNYESDHNTK